MDTKNGQPVRLSPHCTALLADGLHLVKTSDGFSLTNVEALELLDYLSQHKQELLLAVYGSKQITAEQQEKHS